MALNSARNLGVILDTALKLDEQVSKTCSNCHYYLKSIAVARNSFDFITRKTVIMSYVLSRLNFCSLLYVGISEKNLSKLQKVQNSAVRILYGMSKREHISPKLKELGWLSVRNFFEYRYLVTVYKSV